MKTIVNSWNEWDPLKHVIIGKADGTCIPAPEPALDAKVPEDSDMKGKYGPRTKDSVDKANELLDKFDKCKKDNQDNMNMIGMCFSLKELSEQNEEFMKDKIFKLISLKKEFN